MEFFDVISLIRNIFISFHYNKILYELKLFQKDLQSEHYHQVFLILYINLVYLKYILIYQQSQITFNIQHYLIFKISKIRISFPNILIIVLIL